MNTIEEDKELMIRIAQQDAKAYQILVNKYLSMSLRFAERMLGNRQDAEDVTQEIYLKLWKGAVHWKQKSKFSTYLYRTMFNACIDYKRNIVPFVKVEMENFQDNIKTADELVLAQQKETYVQKLLQKLPDRQRAALILSYYEEISNQHVADALGISIRALQQLLFRARQNLKLLLTEKSLEEIND